MYNAHLFQNAPSYTSTTELEYLIHTLSLILFFFVCLQPLIASVHHLFILTENMQCMIIECLLVILVMIMWYQLLLG